jgi:SHS2 domain-containing protein
MANKGSGFKEVPHTADWQLHVWAPSLSELFIEAALGMYSLMGVRSATGPRVPRNFEFQGLDTESLLVAFLSELTLAVEQEHLLFDSFEVDLTGSHLKIKSSGVKILLMTKAIKAVTYHNLKIRATSTGVDVYIVFDV